MAGASAGSNGGSSRVAVTWLADVEKSVLASNFEKRGWTKGALESSATQEREKNS